MGLEGSTGLLGLGWVENLMLSFFLYLDFNFLTPVLSLVNVKEVCSSFR